MISKLNLIQSFHSIKGLNETEQKIGVENLRMMGTKTSFTRYKEWKFERGFVCASERVTNAICILGTGEFVIVNGYIT